MHPKHVYCLSFAQQCTLKILTLNLSLSHKKTFFKHIDHDIIMGDCCSTEDTPPDVNTQVGTAIKMIDDSDESSDDVQPYKEEKPVAVEDDIPKHEDDSDDDNNEGKEHDKHDKHHKHNKHHHKDGHGESSSPMLAAKSKLSRMKSPLAIAQEKKKQQKILDGWKSAVESGNDSLVRTLFNEYSDETDVISAKFSNGDNSLHVACNKRYYEIAYFLIQKGISVNGINETNGNAPIHYACLQRDEKTVKLLLNHNANPYARNKKGRTPIKIAKKLRAHKVEEYIKVAMDAQEKGELFSDNDPDIDETKFIEDTDESDNNKG